MGKKAANDSKIALRRANVCELHLEGKSKRKIAELLGVNFHTVDADIRACHRDWARRRDADISAKVDRELAILEHIFSAAWEALKASQKPEVVRTHEVTIDAAGGQGGAAVTPRRKKTGERVRGRLVEAKLFDTMMQARREIYKLEGLYPVKEDRRQPPPPSQEWGTSEAVRLFIESLAPDEVAMFQRMRARMLTITGQATVIDGTPPPP